MHAPTTQPPIRAVWFDVGEVLVDETRIWHHWADRLGIPRHTFSAVFGAVIARGAHYRHVFDYFGHAPDPAADTEPDITPADLYPDARRCLEALDSAGLYIGIAGNQPTRTAYLLEAFDLPHNTIASSAAWAVHKPDPGFFHKLIDVSGHAPAEILYVGDRLDNDIRPAATAGLRTAFLKRGPWAYVAHEPTPADLEFTNLDDLASYVIGQQLAERGS